MKNYVFNTTNILLTDVMLSQFKQYCNFLLEENAKYDLTAITDVDEVYEKHFCDSVLGAVAIKPNATLCDVGSGAGFPALPLKIVRPDISVTLVDSLTKRVNFQQQLCALLGISATCVHSRAEDFATVNRGKFDVVTARAVAPLNVLLEYTAPLVKLGGIVLAYKTDETETDLARNACNVLGLRFHKAIHFTLPSGSKRCLIVYNKVADTPTKYPRGQNKPRKQPL